MMMSPVFDILLHKFNHPISLFQSFHVDDLYVFFPIWGAYCKKGVKSDHYGMWVEASKYSNATLSHNSLMMRCVTKQIWKSTLSTKKCLPKKRRRKHADEQNNNAVILKIYKLIRIAHFLLRLSTPWPAQGCADIGQPLNANCHCLFFVTKDA